MSAMISFIQQRDVKAFYFVNRRFHSRRLLGIMKFITHMGSLPFVLVLILLSGLLPFSKDTPLQLELATYLLLTHSLVQLIKIVVHRKRPFLQLNEVYSANIPGCRYSFPSGHTNAAFTTALILSQYFPAVKGIFLLLAFLVALSRIYLGVHFPTDTIVGAFIAYTLTTLPLPWIPWL